MQKTYISFIIDYNFLFLSPSYILTRNAENLDEEETKVFVPQKQGNFIYSLSIMFSSSKHFDYFATKKHGLMFMFLALALKRSSFSKNDTLYY
jgi:hypothetical protein